jgi:hypothetical protein
MTTTDSPSGDSGLKPRYLVNALIEAVATPAEAKAWELRIMTCSVDAAVALAGKHFGAGAPVAVAIQRSAFRDRFLDDEVAAIDELSFAEIAALTSTLSIQPHSDFPLGLGVAVFFIRSGVARWALEFPLDASRVLVACGLAPQIVIEAKPMILGILIGDLLFGVEDNREHDEVPCGVELPEWIRHNALSRCRSTASQTCVARELQSGDTANIPAGIDEAPVVVRRSTDARSSRKPSERESCETTNATQGARQGAVPSRRPKRVARSPHPVEAPSNAPPLSQARREEQRGDATNDEPPEIIDVDSTDALIIRADNGAFVTYDAIPTLMRESPWQLPHEVIVSHRREPLLCDEFELQNHYTAAELLNFIKSVPELAQAAKGGSKSKAKLASAIMTFTKSRGAADVGEVVTVPE